MAMRSMPLATPPDSPASVSRTIERWTATSMSLLLSRALTQSDEKLVQLIERLDHCIGCSGAGSVERFFRRIFLAQDHQRLAALFLEGHRGDRPALTTFFVSPREARVRMHFDIRAEKRDRLGALIEYQSVL